MRAQLCLGEKESLLIVSNGKVAEDQTLMVTAPAFHVRQRADDGLDWLGFRRTGEWERHDGYLLAPVVPSSQRDCSVCGALAEVYAMDPCPGGWGDYYCTTHTPRGWLTEGIAR